MRFFCPYISQDQPPVYCGAEWDYIDVRRLAVLTDAEIGEFEKKISKNYLVKAMGIQECPKCNSMVERSNKKHIRVFRYATKIRKSLTISTGIVYMNGLMTPALLSVVGFSS